MHVTDLLCIMCGSILIFQRTEPLPSTTGFVFKEQNYHIQRYWKSMK